MALSMFATLPPTLPYRAVLRIGEIMRIELPGGVAVDMFKALDIARGRDAMRVALTGVNWEMPYGETPVHVFTATDSYRLHSVAIGDAVSINAGLSGIAQSILLSGDIVKAVQVCAKAVGKAGNVVLGLAGDSSKHCFVSGVNVAGDTVSRVTVECLDSLEFPQCRGIVDGANDIELPALFNGKYLAGLIDAATLWAGKDRPVTVESIHARKPGRVTAANDYGTFTGIVMPQRGGK